MWTFVNIHTRVWHCSADNSFPRIVPTFFFSLCKLNSCWAKPQRAQRNGCSLKTVITEWKMKIRKKVLLHSIYTGYKIIATSLQQVIIKPREETQSLRNWLRPLLKSLRVQVNYQTPAAATLTTSYHLSHLCEEWVRFFSLLTVYYQ